MALIPFLGYLYSWKERVKNLANWLDTIIIDLSKRQPIWQKLYEAAVCSINAQPLASHYLVFDRNIADHFYLKLNKEQYFKVLGIYLSTDFFYKKAGYYVEILNLEIMSFDFLTDELEHETFQVVFPQVFTAFSLAEWNISNDFLLDLHWKIKKVYVSKLLVKYHKFLSVLFFYFPEVKAVACTEHAMLTYVNTLSHQMEILFFDKLLTCLQHLSKSDEQKNYWFSTE